MNPTIFLFGESEKGEFGMPIFCKSLFQLSETLGNPPDESLGIFYAIQALLFERTLFFCRVQEEGFSIEDYLKGLYELSRSKATIPHAIMIPGVGNSEIIEAASSLCTNCTILVITSKDLYDYLTFTKKLN